MQQGRNAVWGACWLVRRRSGTHEGWAVWARAEVRGNACVSAGKDAEGVPGATTKKVVLVCPYASCLGFSGRSQRKPTLGDAGSVQASRGDVRSARSGEGGQGRMHGEAVTCHLSKEVFCIRDQTSRTLSTAAYTF